MTDPIGKTPVVEPAPVPPERPAAGAEALQLRIRQQAILSELGVFALQGMGLTELFSQTARLTAEGLEAEFCKIMRYLPEQQHLLVAAEVGWGNEILGEVMGGTDPESPAGYALLTGKPVISNHLEAENRFRTPALFAKHGIRRAINVILQGEGTPFGVLEVDSRDPGEFSEHDLAFLQGAANILGMAIARRRHEEQLKDLLQHREVLLKEVNHRVKNSLQLVASTLRLQAASVKDEVVSEALGDAHARVMAIARAHERLYRTTEFTHLDVTAYLREVCADLDGSALRFEGPEGIRVETDRAIPLALLVSELVTNSRKYAYPDRNQGPVWVRVVPAAQDKLELSVADEGIGLPPDFDPGATRGLGMRLVKAFAQKLGAKLEFRNRNPGTEVVLTLPRENGEPA